MEKLVSVIIPCFNDYLYIKEAIESINNQDYNNIEIIIIDDGSNLKTKKVLNKISQHNIRLIVQKNLGPSVARNEGIKLAKGDYILTLDADDYFEPSFISRAISIIEANDKIGMISCWAKIFGDRIKEEQYVKPKGGGLFEVLFQFHPFALGSLLYRKQCWEKINGYDENMKNGYEDWEFNISVIKQGWEIFIIEDFLFNYRDRPNSRNSLANKNYQFELRKYIYLKHKNLYEIYWDTLIEQYYDLIIDLEKKNNLIFNSLDYKIGKTLLKPIRILNNILK
tara:strand:+ start:4951 stop:5793 length:843 start_codon:yes stop_codon:yes gene_type:complete